jgi:hypothetical protein
MPTYDGGHYFLTVLLPVITEPIPDGPARTSPVHALRKQLAMLPVSGQSPLARNTRNHFVRFSIIDDVAYNGREQTNVLWALLKRINPAVAQPQDHLTCPFLYFAAEFDAASSTDAERDSYLVALWETMQKELKDIFTFCAGFDADVNDAASFAKYITRCQIATTMSFKDYYVDPLNLPTWPADKYLIPAGLGAVLLALGFVVWFFFCGGLILLLVGAATFGAGIWLAYVSVMAAGAKPFPAAPDSNLPAVLKALHLQQAFTRFAIDNQPLAVNASSADEFHTAFGNFVVRYRPNNLDGPTQPPGVIGI